MKRIVLLLAIAFCVFANAHSMTYDQMARLKGVNMLDERANVLVTRYGLPGAIVDHGVTTDEPRKKVKWKTRELNLTDGDWNLFYSNQKIEKSDSRYWINPNRIFPGEFSNLGYIIFYTFGKQNYLRYDIKLKKFLEEKPKSLFEYHLIYGVYGSFVSPLPRKEITDLYGSDYDKTRDELLNNVLRYWVVKTGKNGFPEKVYCADFINSGNWIEGYKIYSDSTELRDKWSELIDKWTKENMGEDSVEGSNE